jgi:GH24 family phage-related lysozyme (muramidase)
MYLDDSVAQTEVFEGKVPTMYRDTKGNVTVGVGLELPTLESALDLPFYRHAGVQPDVRATEAEIETDYYRVANMNFGGVYGPAYFAQLGALFLQGADIDKLLRSFVVKNDAALASHFTSYDSWPSPAKLGYLDMVYNLGPMRLFVEYTHMNAAAAIGDWKTCAGQCSRDASDPAFVRRNQWTIQQFLAAAAA